jgi:type I restriction enzyme S subunit
MSHYKPYPAYKDSGVEWIGEVPKDWGVKPIKIIASCNDDSLPEFIPPDTPIRYVDISAVSHDVGISGAEPMVFGEAPSRARRKAKVGDVVVSTVRTYLKAVASVDDAHADCVYSTGFAVLRARSEQLAPEFLKWLALNDLLIQAVESHSEGLSYPAINSSELVNLKTVVPGLPEQRHIALILDRETARIDALIAKKTRFIELLKEKRSALITHAVTKGLDPNVKMKDSGVEWIGEVPEHWKVRPIKSLATGAATLFIDGDWIESKNLADSGIRYITTGNVGEGEYKEQGSGFISEETFDELRCTEVLPGDVLISRLNPPIGRACIAPNLRSRVVTSVDNVILRPGAEFDSMFIVFRFSAKDYFHEMSLLGSGATMQRVSRTELGNLRVAWPPLNEQIEISRHIQAETMQIDTLSERVGNSIDLLKERRSAFITAAVTGQIDLRESA